MSPGPGAEVAQRANTAPCDCYPLKGLLPRLARGSWELGLREGSHHPDRQEQLTGPDLWFMLNTCFPPGSLEFRYVLGRGCLTDQSLMKTLGTEFLMSFSNSHASSRLTAVGIKSILCDFTGRGPWKFVPSVPWPLPMSPFPLSILLCVL